MVGLFSKVFGKKTKNTQETTLDLLPTLIQHNFKAKIETLELEMAKEMSEVKYLHEKCKTLLKDIKQKELDKKENERFNKAAITAKKQIELQMEKALDKTNPNNIGSELQEIRAYSNESYLSLINEINSFRKGLVYTSVYLKDEMKAFGETLQELLNKLNKIRNELEKEKELFEFEKIKTKINNLIENQKSINDLNKKQTEFDKLILEKKKKIKECDDEKNKISESADMLEVKNLGEELSKISHEKQELKTEVSSMISTIDRPLQRFEGLVKSGRWKINKEQEELLSLFITNPLFALKKDVNGKKFKEILKEILDAINDGKIELKDKEKEKRVDALQELINFDFFEKVFWRLNEIQKRQAEIEKKLKDNSASLGINEIEHQRNEIERDIEKINEEKRTTEKEIENIKKIIEQEKEKIVIFAEKVTNAKIVLK